MRHRLEGLFLYLLYLFLVISTSSGSMSASTGYPNEIISLHVENVTQTSADIVWTTVHPSTSQVLIARDANYAPEIRIPWTVTIPPLPPPPPPCPRCGTPPPPKGLPVTGGVNTSFGYAPPGPMDPLVTQHVVHVTGLRPYNSYYRFGTYYYYVASVDARGVMSTAPGPADYLTRTLPSFQTLPTDTSILQSFLIYTYGPTNVFAGSDLYFAAELHQLGGGTFFRFTDVVNQTGPNNGSDGIVTGLTPATQQSAGTISVHFACSENSASDAGDQTKDPWHPALYGCYTSYRTMPGANFRLRTSANTVPGPYAVAFTYINGDAPTTTTYRFNVVAAPTFTATPPTVFPAIPGKANWETQMVVLGHRWCDDHNGFSRDSRNSAGLFLTGWGWQEESWFYDGGRVYQQADDYTANQLGQPNHALWQHCALTDLDPYGQYALHNNGAFALYSEFAYGMAMNYLRTHNQDMKNAVLVLANTATGSTIGGYVDWYMVRESSYINNSRIASEMVGNPHSHLTDIGINKLLGDLDQVANGGKVNAVHPFMVGIAMQTLINYYEWNASRGVVDNRIPVAIKQALDALWTIWNPTHFSFAYDNTSLPSNDSYYGGNDTIDWTDLNGLVATAYAWYWSKTGDSTALSRGNMVFQHMLDPLGDPSWSGKMYSQMYQWTFDYVRLRNGPNAGLTILPSQNPYTGPYADTEPPIMGGAGYTKVMVSPTGTGATITWNTYEPATTQVKYGVTSGYGSASSPNPSLVTSHSVALTGLLPATLYHYQVISADAVGNIAALADQTFTTTP
jgi:hypothetical protein